MTAQALTNAILYDASPAVLDFMYGLLSSEQRAELLQQYEAMPESSEVTKVRKALSHTQMRFVAAGVDL